MTEPSRGEGAVRSAHYVFDVGAPFPKRWRDHIGPVSIMAGPVKGWFMVRRPGAEPFCLRVSDLCNATRSAPHGPFEVVGVKTVPFVAALASPVPQEGQSR